MTDFNPRLEDKMEELTELYRRITEDAEDRIHAIREGGRITGSASEANLTAQDVMPLMEETISMQRVYFNALQKIALELSKQMDIQLGISTTGADNPMNKHELLELIQKQIDCAKQQNFL